MALFVCRTGSFGRQDAPPAIGRYVRNRLLRIVPGFWLIFTAVLLIVGTLGSNAGQIAAVYGFLENYHESQLAAVIGQNWTLHVELVFYLLVPIAAVGASVLAGPRFGSRGRLAVVVVATIAVGIASLALRELIPHAARYQRMAPAMLFAFVPGVLLAAVEIQAHGRLRARSGQLLGLTLIPLGLAS